MATSRLYRGEDLLSVYELRDAFLRGSVHSSQVHPFDRLTTQRFLSFYQKSSLSTYLTPYILRRPDGLLIFASFFIDKEKDLYNLEQQAVNQYDSMATEYGLRDDLSPLFNAS